MSGLTQPVTPSLQINPFTDVYLRSNFQNLQTYFANQNQLLGFKFFELVFTSAVTNYTQAHGLSVIPQDIIVTKITGSGTVTFNTGLFTSTNLSITTTGACRVRFFAGTYWNYNSSAATSSTDYQQNSSAAGSANTSATVSSSSVTAIATGCGTDFWGSTLPSGYIWASGLTIGNATSGATERANADTLSLYTLLWNSFTNSILPIYSAGIAASRGFTAAADFAAGKTLQVPDKRSRVSVGPEVLGASTAASRLTSGNYLTGITPGSTGGEQNHALAIAELAAHSHTYSDSGHTHNFYTTTAGGGLPGTYGATGGPQTSSSGYVVPTTISSITINNTGSGTAHNNLQPLIVCNYIIKL